MYCRIQEEQDEVFVVEFAHTVAHPWAMMVHTDYALFAYRAVVDSLLLYYVAFEAIAYFVQRLYLFVIYLSSYFVLPPFLLVLGLGPCVYFYLLYLLPIVHVLHQWGIIYSEVVRSSWWLNCGSIVADT